MADKDTSGIERLRKLSRDVSPMPMWVCLRCGNEGDLGGYVNATVREVLNDLADQIERERAEELAAAKRDLTDEAREAVERLRRLDGDDVYDPYGNGWKNNWKAIEEAIGADCSCVRTYQEDLNSVRDRIIELIEHGGKRDVDAAALQELADDLESLEVAASSVEFASGYEDGCEYAAERIRKAVEGATVPDAESDAERACAALLDWRDQVAGLLGIDAGSMADEVQDAIMDELDKRLMPPGMEWPRWEDGKPLCEDDAPDGVTVVSLYLDGSGYGLVDAMLNHQAGERVKIVKRPEPEALGADGEPIKVGDTVWDSTSPNDPTSSTVWRHGGPLKVLRRNDVRAGFVICENDQGIPLDCLAADLTHAAPDTQERIDDDATSDPATYCGEVLGWDADKIVHRTDYAAQNEAMIADLLRRQRELDAKTMGGDA